MRIGRLVMCSVVVVSVGAGCKQIDPGAADGGSGDAPPAPGVDAARDAPSDAAPAPPGDALGAGPSDAPADAASDAPPADAPPGPAPGDATPIDLDLGHVAPVDQVLRSGNAAVSRDRLRHWVLWDLAARDQVGSGDLAVCPSPFLPCGFDVALAGATLAVRGAGGIELRDAATGDWLTTLPDADNAGLASDGSYAWIATASGLKARSRSGVVLVDIAGDYSHAAVFGAPDQLRVAGGAAGGHSLETISITDGHTTTAAFTGTFASWFDDGQRFLTVIGTVVYVFDQAGVRQTLGALPTVERLTGQGDFVWTLASNTLRVYAFSDLTAPLLTLGVGFGTTAMPGGGVIGVLPYGVEHLQLITLGFQLTVSEVAVPAGYLSAFGGDAAGHWMVGSSAGAVFDGDAIAAAPAAAQSLSLGRPSALAGSPGATAVLGTGSRRTVVLTLGDGATTVRLLDLPAGQAAITADESTLVASDTLDGAQYHEDRSLRVISLASGEVTHTWPYTWDDRALLVGFELAPAGRIVAFDVAEQYLYSDLEGSPLPGYGPTSTDQTTPVPHLSPDGTRAAFTLRGSGGAVDWDRNLGATTQLYRNGSLVGAVNGVFQTWLDDDRVAVATYRVAPGFRWVEFDTMSIYDGQGTLLGPARLPDPLSSARNAVISVDGRLAYLRFHNAVYDTATGAVVWQGDPATTNGTVVGHHVVYTLGRKVYRADIPAPPPAPALALPASVR